MNDKLIRAIEECIYKLDAAQGERAKVILISRNLEREFMEEVCAYSGNIAVRQDDLSIAYRGIAVQFSDKIDGDIVSVLGENSSMEVIFQKFLFNKQEDAMDPFCRKFLEILRR